MKMRALVVAALLTTLAPVARADVLIDRIVAVVGTHVITIQELKERAAPQMKLIDIQKPDEMRRAALTTELLKKVLQAMIDDQLAADDAAKARVAVTEDEIDLTLKNVAAATKLTVAELLAEAARQGLSEVAYRAELRRQLTRGKMVSLRATKGGLSPKASPREREEALAKEQTKWLSELRQHAYVDVRL